MSQLVSKLYATVEYSFLFLIIAACSLQARAIIQLRFLHSYIENSKQNSRTFQGQFKDTFTTVANGYMHVQIFDTMGILSKFHGQNPAYLILRNNLKTFATYDVTQGIK